MLKIGKFHMFSFSMYLHVYLFFTLTNFIIPYRNRFINTIHHLLEYMGSTFKEYLLETSLLQNPQKVIFRTLF